MQEVNEITLLKEGNIKITNQRVIIGARSYSLDHIASVRVQEDEPKLFFPIFFMLVVSPCLAFFALTDIRDLSLYLTGGLYVGITSLILFFLSGRTKYSVRVRSRVGELNLLQADDLHQVERIVGAMHEAIENKE
jgi:hypothetical protein